MKRGNAFHAVSFVLTVFILTGCNQMPTDTARAATNSVASAPATTSSAGTPAPPAVTSESIPLRSIISLQLDGPDNDKDMLVRIKGTVLDRRPGEFIVVNDGTGTLLAETHQAALPQIKEPVDLSGRVVVDGNAISLKDAVVRPPVASGSTNEAAAIPSVRPAKLPVLTNAWKIRDLPAEMAAWHFPVRLQAIVTVNNKISRYFFAQDETSGIYIVTPDIPAGLNPGDVVQIEGVSDPGGFAPIVQASKITVLGQAPLPNPNPATLFQLATGQEGSQWIEVRGVVHSIDYNSTNGIAQLHLNDLGGMIVVNVPANSAPTNLLDAIVRIQGACGSRSNDKRQFTGYVMFASSLDNVQVEEPGMPDPLNRPAQSIASLGQFHPRQTLQHRMNVAGIVTYVEPGFFFIQDADEGVRVEPAMQAPLKPGDYVMASGYPGMGNYGYLLQNAVFKVVSHRQMPAPQPLSLESPLTPELHDRWVQIKARLLYYSKIGTTDVLTLQTGNKIFDVRTLSPLSNRFRNLKTGTELQVNGIYRVLSDETRTPKAFQLAVPAESDMRILSEPSWWTIQNTVTLVASMGVVIGATILWVLLLQRKVREQTASLQQSEHKFRSLVELSLLGVYIVQDGRFVYVNPRLAAIFGYTPEEMIESCLLEDVIFHEDRPMVREQIRRRIAEEIESAHYLFRGRRKDGSLIQAEVHGSRTEFGGRPAVLGTLVDVTERKLSQDKIAEQARMLDLASDAIMVCGLDDRITYWNQNARRIFGWTEQQAVGGLAFEKLRITPADFQKAKAALLQNRQWHGEFHHRDHHDGELTVAARWTLVHDSQGKPGSILTISTDITQQKKLEAQLLRTQRLDSIGVLAGGIAHDLNNVLAPILMSAQLLEMEPDLPPELRQLATTILGGTHRAAGLVRQILTFARGTGGHRHTVQPLRELEELRKILHETLPKSISLKINPAPNVRTINADATQVHQVLMNLCINARDAMPNGGELTIAVANCELDKPPTAFGGEFKPGPHVVFSVTDNGSGMSQEIRDRIFEPFFTTKEVGKGTGLGLSTALGIVKSHGGFIHVQSQPGHGTCFKVYLPAQPDAPAPAETPKNGNRIQSGNNELVLVVDDEAPLREIARQTLVMFGYRVVTAGNGREAVECYKQQKDEIALVFTDMMMPVMDGPAAIQELARINPKIKVVATSGRTDESRINHPAIHAFLSKPYTAEQLLIIVHQALHTTATPAQAAG